MNCPKCGLINTGNMAVGLAMPQCMCQWQSIQEKSRIETVPAQGTLLPKREWQGLTDEEHMQIAVDVGCMSSDWLFYGAAVERALKNKNT